jgi:hypothetical protein
MSYWAASTQASSGLSPLLVIIIVVLVILFVLMFRNRGGASARSRCDQKKGLLGRCNKETCILGITIMVLQHGPVQAQT